MHWMLLAALISSSPQTRSFDVAPADATAIVAGHVETGSLIVSEGDCLAVKIFTRSPYTHVGAVVMRHGQPYVYDSANGAGVRCQTLANYLASQTPAEVHLFQPGKPMPPKRAERFEKHLDDQLGRPYAIRHHLTGKRADGIHCAEYVTDALIACDMLEAKEPSRVSPASLLQGVTTSDLYHHRATLRLTPAAPLRAEREGWCSAMWSDTKQCTRHCYLKMRGWFCCY